MEKAAARATADINTSSSIITHQTCVLVAYPLAAHDWLLSVGACHQCVDNQTSGQDASIQPEVPAQ